MNILCVFSVIFVVAAIITIAICHNRKPTTIDPITSSYRNAKTGDCLKARKS